MPDYIVRAKFQGSDGVTTSRTFDFGTRADETALSTAWALFMSAYMAVADVLLTEATYSAVLSTGVGAANRPVWNTALLNVNTNAEGTKTTDLYIPGANDNVFVAASGANYNVVDTSDAAIVALVAAYDTYNVQVSDGELVDTTAQNGIANGRRKIRSIKGL